MSSVEDWVKKAAEEIARTQHGKQTIYVQEIVAIIEAHCPFKRDVLYEPVACPKYSRPEGVMGGPCLNCGRSQPDHVRSL